MTKWRFKFEGTEEVVALGGGVPFGPWDTEAEAIDALDAEFGTNNPSNLCYDLVAEEDVQP